MNKFMYVSQLEDKVQKEIKKDIIKFIELELEVSEEEKEEIIENGMNSKLVDLEDTIDINKYI